MAKYSTGSGGDSAGGNCELCGTDGGDLQTASVAGATLQVCDSCAREHGETERTTSSDSSRDDQDRNRKRRAARNTAKMQDVQTTDAAHWEDGADYDDDQLPYLVSQYGDRVTEARQERGLQTSELAAELDLEEADVLAVEQGRATQANLGGSVIEALEQYLEVELVESN